MTGRCSVRSVWGVGVGLLVAAPAMATPSTRLTYQRAAGTEHCPEEPVLRRAVEQRLGYDPFFPWADPRKGRRYFPVYGGAPGAR